MKEILLPILATIAFISIVGFLTSKNSNIASNSNWGKASVEESKTQTLKIKDIEIKVEIANSEAKRQKGLSRRSYLEDDKGMLFIFAKENETPTFWMKDMLFPIDIIWINDGKISQIEKNIQQPKEGTPESRLKIYSPKIPIDYALEVNAGFSDKNNFSIEDSVDLSSLE